MVTPSAKKASVNYLVNSKGFTVQMACKTLRLNRSTYYYESKRREFEELLVKELHRISRKHPRWGYQQVTAQLRRAGWRVNHKRVQRLWRQEGLKVPVKQVKRRRSGKSTRPRQAALYPNHVWSWDFLFDRTEDGRSLKILNIVDEYSRLNVCLEVSRSFTGKDVVEALGKAMVRHGIPGCIRSDNGSEFISKSIKNWLEMNAIGIHYIDPASPWQNPYVESLNARLRDECLNRELFTSLLEAKVVINDWRDEYNQVRAHGGINFQTPTEVFEKFIAQGSPMGDPWQNNCTRGYTQLMH